MRTNVMNELDDKDKRPISGATPSRPTAPDAPKPPSAPKSKPDSSKALPPDEAAPRRETVDEPLKDIAASAAKAVELLEIRQSIDEKFARNDQRFDQTDRRFDQIDRRFNQVDQRFTQIDRKFENMDDKLTHLGDSLRQEMKDGFEKLAKSQEILRQEVREDNKALRQEAMENNKALRQEIKDSQAGIAKLQRWVHIGYGAAFIVLIALVAWIQGFFQ